MVQDLGQLISRCRCRSAPSPSHPALLQPGTLPHRRQASTSFSHRSPSHRLQGGICSPMDLLRLQVGVCSPMDLPGLRAQPASPWPSPQAAGESLLQHQEHLPHQPECLQGHSRSSRLLRLPLCSSVPPSVTPRAAATSTTGLARSRWHRLCKAQGKLLAAAHRSHPCSPLLPKPRHTNPIEPRKTDDPATERSVPVPKGHGLACQLPPATAPGQGATA